MRRCLYALLLAGCATAPPVDKAGLPRVGRYTTPTQLDWMLGTYADLAQRSPDPQVREAACLGWERAVFDLESLQMYSVVLRMSTDAAGLQALRDDLGSVVKRHPLPAACGPVQGGPPSAQDIEAAVTKSEEQKTEDLKGAPGEGTSESGQPQPIAQPGPPQAQPAVPAITERQLLAELRRALRLHRDGREVSLGGPEGPGIQAPEGVVKQAGGPAAAAAMFAVDEAKLIELAGDKTRDLPTIQLRARFHLLGRCQSLVERVDAYPTETGRCAGAAPGESPRRSMRRLRDQLLRAFSRRYVEPMSDIVIALANSTSRDNPLVDGPRVSR